MIGHVTLESPVEGVGWTVVAFITTMAMFHARWLDDRVFSDSLLTGAATRKDETQKTNCQRGQKLVRIEDEDV